MNWSDWIYFAGFVVAMAALALLILYPGGGLDWIRTPLFLDNAKPEFPESVEIHKARRLYVATRAAATYLDDRGCLFHDSGAIEALASRPIDVEIGGTINLLELVQKTVEAWNNSRRPFSLDQGKIIINGAPIEEILRVNVDGDDLHIQTDKNPLQPLAIAGNGHVLQRGTVDEILEELDPESEAARLIRYMASELEDAWEARGAFAHTEIDVRDMTTEIPIKTLDSVAAEAQTKSILQDIESKPSIDHVESEKPNIEGLSPEEHSDRHKRK